MDRWAAHNQSTRSDAVRKLIELRPKTEKMSGKMPTELEEIKKLQRAQERRDRRQSEIFARYVITAIETDNCEALSRIGTSNAPNIGWHLVFHHIVKGAAPEISPQIKSTFQQVWLEHKQLARHIGKPSLVRRALQRLLPPYSGPAVTLYRGATLKGWREGVSWTASIDIARSFLLEPDVAKSLHALNSFNGNPANIPVIVKTLAPPEAIICKIEYPEPFTKKKRDGSVATLSSFTMSRSISWIRND